MSVHKIRDESETHAEEQERTHEEGVRPSRLIGIALVLLGSLLVDTGSLHELDTQVISGTQRDLHTASDKTESMQ